MKTQLFLPLILLASATLLPAATNDLTSLLQQGLLDEEASHDLHAAITDYQSLAAQFDKDRDIAATAIYRLGECYRKLGQTNEAAAQYQRIVREFPDQKSLVTLSLQNLTGLGISTSPAASMGNSDARLWEKLKNLAPGELERVLPVMVPDAALSEMLQRRTQAKTELDLSQNTLPPQDPRVLQLTNLVGLYEKQISAKIDEIMQTLKIRAEFSEPDLPTTPPATAALQAQQALLQDEIALAEKQSAVLQQQAAAGVVTQNDVLVAQQKLLELKQQLAALQARQAASTLTVPTTDAEDQKISELKAIIQDSPDLIHLSGGGDHVNPLVQAAYDGQLRVAAFLLDIKADVNVGRGGGTTPLVAAAQSGHKAMAEFLLSHGADVNAAEGGGRTALQEAARLGYVAVAEVLLANHADVNALSNDGRTPLSFAAEKDSPEMIKLLLANKADPNAGNLNAPLLCAIQQKDIAAATLLLQAGANPNAEVPFDLSIAMSGPVPQFLLQHLPISPLFLAAYTEQPVMVKLLLRNKADPNAPQVDDRPLIFSALGDSNILSALLDAGAKVEAIESDPHVIYDTRLGNPPDLTPLAAAAFTRNAAAVEILLQHGANPNERNPVGNTPLHCAALGLADTNVFAVLLAAKADPNVRNNDGQTALDFVKAPPSYISNARATVEILIDWLRNHGALDNPPDLSLISVSRPSANFSSAILHKATNDWNHFTLLEVVAMQCQFLAASPRESGRLDDSSLFWQQMPLPFPDLAHVHIRRPSADLKTSTEQTVDIAADLATGNCTNDVPVEWGDTVEIPEADHPLNEKWPGLSVTELKNLMACLSRRLEVIVNGKTNSVTLAPGIQWKEGGLDISTETSFWLKPVLLKSKVVLSSSDLSRVQVTRRDAKTGQTRQWIIDCTEVPSSAPGPFGRGGGGGAGLGGGGGPGGGFGGGGPVFPAQSSGPGRRLGRSVTTDSPSESDLWLRDGDVIEIPEKP